MRSQARGTATVVEAHALPRRLWLYALVIGLVVLLVAAFITEITLVSPPVRTSAAGAR